MLVNPRQVPITICIPYLMDSRTLKEFSSVDKNNVFSNINTLVISDLSELLIFQMLTSGTIASIEPKLLIAKSVFEKNEVRRIPKDRSWMISFSDMTYYFTAPEQILRYHQPTQIFETPPLMGLKNKTPINE